MYRISVGKLADEALGSVALQGVQHARCPVLIVPPHTEGAPA